MIECVSRENHNALDSNISNKKICGSSNVFCRRAQNDNAPENMNHEHSETNDDTFLGPTTKKFTVSRTNAKRTLDTSRDNFILLDSENTSQASKTTFRLTEVCSNKITKNEDAIKVVDLENNLREKATKMKDFSGETMKVSFDKKTNVTKRNRNFNKQSTREFINSDGTKTVVQPKVGDHVINVPYTNAVLCISQKDIVCTIGLSCQLTILIITFILCSVAFRMSGKIVPVSEFFQKFYGLEVGFILNSMVNPVVCVIFSTNFREAFKSMVT